RRGAARGTTGKKARSRGGALGGPDLTRRQVTQWRGSARSSGSSSRSPLIEGNAAAGVEQPRLRGAQGRGHAGGRGGSPGEARYLRIPSESTERPASYQSALATGPALAERAPVSLRAPLPAGRRAARCPGRARI